ncbi:hypothetical protein ACIP93_33370 [Streptomyces sp. NPDC088745]|uniref:hypothetical protein n=1 Tax=Streptomyces sp. NPDC088745 TaxID=3365884 RepID=UPI0037F3F74B
MGWRYIAERVITGDILDWDVPLVPDGPPKRELSGPGGLTATITPEYLRLNTAPDGMPVLAEWSTALYAEYEGRIRWGGLITHIKYQGQALKLTVAGFSSYPHGLPYLGSSIQSGMLIPQKYAYEGRDKNNDGYVDGSKPKRKMPPRPKDKVGPRLDAFDVVRTIWAHVQDYTHGNLRMVVDRHDAGYAMGAPSGKDPYELRWWDYPDCGQAIDNVMQQAGADYAEWHGWDGNRERINHRLLLGRKRLGRSRPDLRFAQGENIVELASPQGMGERFANEIYMVGAGSGRTTPTVRTASRDKRLRRARVIPRKTTTSRMQLLIWGQAEQRRNAQMLTIPSIAVRDHANARLGSWDLGDLILVQVDVPWVGEIQVWHRIVAEEIDPVAGSAILTLTRADQF